MPQATELLKQAREALTAKSPETAVRLYEQFLAAGGTLSAAEHVNAAKAFAAAGNPTLALRHLVRIVDRHDSTYAAWLAASRTLDLLPESTFESLPRRLRIVILSTWNAREFSQFLRLAAARCGIAAAIEETPYGQYFNFPLDPHSELYEHKPDVIVLCPDYRATGVTLSTESPDQALHEHVQRWQLVWDAIHRQSGASIIQLGFAVPAFDEFGHLGQGIPGSQSGLMRDLNLNLAREARRRDIGFVDTDAIAAQFGKAGWFDDRNWHWAKIALSSRGLPTLARHSAAVLAARAGLSRRCLVLDLDNTLWGGVIGDDGITGIRLGGGPDGEAYQEFQRSIKTLSARGVVLAVCSKNDPKIAREPFLHHPEMILRLEDFAVFEASWEPKSIGIQRVAQLLDLGLSSLTFVDDNPYEREQVRQSLPDVDLLELPSDPTGYAAALAAYPYLEIPSFTAEDRDRSRQYRARTAARQLKEEVASLAEYQSHLNMVATLKPVDSINLDRAVQLINKTNQFNLTTRRRNREEVIQLLAQDNVEMFVARLRDCFADHGIVAVAIGIQDEASLGIDTLLMSCRVIGRDLERVVINEMVERARRRGCADVQGWYLPTERNTLVANLYSRAGFELIDSEADGATLWRRPVDRGEDQNDFIKVERS
ncbi:MAG: HAD-IIIC family phosphatase [Pirellulaceae bacterium]